jgi:DNA-binding response OmpR family regulator
MRKLLFVEDDLNLSSIVKESLEDLGFEVRHVITGEEAIGSIKEDLVDVILMDVELPGEMNGFETAEVIRETYPVLPILFATARQSGKDFERGFKIKYMDYVRKPYRIKEIALRIEGLIGVELKKEKIISIGKFRFDPVVRRLSGNGKEIHLSYLESELLALLGENLDKVVCKEIIIQALWSSNDDPKSKEGSVHNLVYVLRKYLKEDPSLLLEVVSKQGYRITSLPCLESVKK